MGTDLLNRLKGLTRGQFGELFERLRLDPTHYFPDSEELTRRAVQLLQSWRGQQRSEAELHAAIDGVLRPLSSEPPPPSPRRVKQPKPGAANSTTLLFLGASPTDLNRTALGKEVREIKRNLRESKLGRRFKVAEEWAVRPADLHPILLRHTEAARSGTAGRIIVHFSGHGGTSGRIALEDDHGQVQTVPIPALAEFFELYGGWIDGVVLNACYSETQAEAVRPHVNWVVGVRNTIPDEAAIAFSSAFYLGLGHAQDVEMAVKMGRSQIALTKTGGAETVVLLRRTDPPSGGGGAGAGGAASDGAAPSGTSAGSGDSSSGSAGNARGVPWYTEVLQEEVWQLKAWVAARLTEAPPSVARELASRLLPREASAAASPERVADALVDAPGERAASALAAVHSLFQPRSAERNAVAELLHRTLPLLADLRTHLARARANAAGQAAPDSGGPADLLPLLVRTETMAEVILAGLAGTPCEFEPNDSLLPEGTARVALPPEAHAPFFSRDGDTLVKAVVANMGRESRQSTDRWLKAKQRFSHPDQYDQLLIALDGVLRRMRGAPGGRPHYLLFVDDDLDPKGVRRKELVEFYGVATRALSASLPALSLVRLTGGNAELRAEEPIALCIADVRDSSTP